MPNTLFISYSRKQQDKAIQLDNVKLNQFYWWMDYRIVGTVDWWKNICENIEESYCMVALLSKTYIESVYCMGELEYALKLNKPTLCLMLEPDVTYPAALSSKNVQYVNMHEWEVNRVVQVILESMYRVERDYNERVYHRDISHRPYLRPPVPTPPSKSTSDEDQEIAAKVHNAQSRPAPPIRIGEAIIKATQALDDEAYDEVIDLLEPVRPHAKDTDQEVIHDLLREARLGQEYAQITALVRSKRLQARGCQQYTKFRQTYPDYPDAAHLRGQCISKVYNILPAPFDWIDIPAGKVTLEAGGYVPEGGQTFNVPAFSIAKYPITHAQYAKFIEAGGYRERQWWTDAGWEAREKGWEWVNNAWKATGEAWTQPRYWHDARWNGAEYPVVGVSWYEAVAFCTWLSAASGEKVALPTEQQWQRAAQGDDGRAYPWGSRWESGRCNTIEAGIGKTTPVRQYEGIGDSPFGVVDVVGNVWEWCLTEYGSGNTGINGTERRVLRGGSFGSLQLSAAASYRNDLYPHYDNYYFGVRVVCAAPVAPLDS